MPLKSLFQRWPDLSLAVKESEITWRKRPGLKAIDRLPVLAGRRLHPEREGAMIRSEA